MVDGQTAGGLDPPAEPPNGDKKRGVHDWPAVDD
jgi:hypothetical protein